MSIYKPTWLYIKQHNVTGLKYFGMTRCKYINSYTGSGKYWKLHLKKHGTNITTLWCQLFDNENELIEYAINFSKTHNIVESNEWANLVPETGVYGKSAGLKGWKHTESAKRKISEFQKGRPGKSGMAGKKHTAESKEKCSKTLSGRKRPNFIPKSKQWVVTDLHSSTSEVIINLSKWCIDHDINYQLMHRNLRMKKPYKNYLVVENT